MRKSTRQSARSRMLSYIVVLAAVFLSSCDESYTQDDVAFRLATWISELPPVDYYPEAMQALCDLDAGSSSTPIFNVSGYARLLRVDRNSISSLAKGEPGSPYEIGGCFPCLQELIIDRFEFVETYYQSAADRKRIGLEKGFDTPDYVFRDQYVSETGLYRYELMSRVRSPEACRPFDDAVERAWRHSFSPVHKPDLQHFWRMYNELKTDLGDRCVVASRVSELTAPYIFETEVERVGSEPWWLVSGYIQRERERIVRRKDSAIVAQATAYRYLVHAADGRFHRRSSCGKTKLPDINQILFPTVAGVR